MPKIDVYDQGPFSLYVCAESQMTQTEVGEAVNRKYPTGLVHGWSFAQGKRFRNDQPNPCHCPRDNHRRHWLFHCE
jgi:hypothetical protein